jgi:phage-related protein
VSKRPKACRRKIRGQESPKNTAKGPCDFLSPVREWLRRFSREDREHTGEDIWTVEFGCPIGMPVCRPLGEGISEVRTGLGQNRIARVLFYIDGRGRMDLLHGSIKKTQKTPREDSDLAKSNKAKH